MPINTIILRNSIPRGAIIYVKTTQLNAELITITEVKVILIPTAVSILFETPKKIHKPKNLVNTKLFINDAATTNSKSFPKSIFPQIINPQISQITQIIVCLFYNLWNLWK